MFSTVVFVVEFLGLMHCDQKEWMGLLYFLIFANASLRYDQFWRMFYALLRRMYIVWKLDEIF
jgi:hypothetical protein